MSSIVSHNHPFAAVEAVDDARFRVGHHGTGHGGGRSSAPPKTTLAPSILFRYRGPRRTQQERILSAMVHLQFAVK